MWKAGEREQEAEQSGAEPIGSVKSRTDLSAWQLRAVHVNTRTESGGGSSGNHGLLVSGEPLSILSKLENQTFSVYERQHAVYALLLQCFVWVRDICCIVAVSVARRGVEEQEIKRNRNDTKMVINVIHGTFPAKSLLWVDVILTVADWSWTRQAYNPSTALNMQIALLKAILLLFPLCVSDWNRLAFLTATVQLMRVLS